MWVKVKVKIKVKIRVGMYKFSVTVAGKVAVGNNILKVYL